MYCLHCGDCCLRMSPISQPNPCPNLIVNGDFYFCGIYKNRPQECRSHEFYSRFCPIGLNVLKPNSIEDIKRRIDDGYMLTQSIHNSIVGGEE